MGREGKKLVWKLEGDVFQPVVLDPLDALLHLEDVLKLLAFNVHRFRRDGALDDAAVVA